MNFAKQIEKKFNSARINGANRLGPRKSANVLRSIVWKKVKSQYRNSTLGVLWTVLNPLLNMIVLAFVFSNIFGRTIQSGMDYPVYLLTGNIVFGLLRGGTSSALTCMVDSRDMMLKTRVPYYVFPLSNVCLALVNFTFSLIALIVVMLIRMSHGIVFSWHMILMPFTFLPAIFMFTLGIALILSTMYVYFRDIKHIYGVVLTMWTYCTPLFYDINMLGDQVAGIMQFNPMYHFVTYFREIMVLGIVPDAKTHLIIYGSGIIALLIGAIAFRAKRRKFVFFI